MSALTLRGVTMSFGDTPVLHGVDLRVPEESFTAVLGPSGCGKTTMLRLIAGFLDPQGGTICFGDRVVVGDGRAVPAQKRRVGYVPQEGALFPHLSVAANIGFGLPRSGRRHRGRIEELLELVGLAPSLRDRMPHELSGGQQQRVALARALAPAPSVVLLDEPFASLDAGLREGTSRAVAGALHEARATTILVTHDQSEALSLADQVAVMREGRLIQVASPRSVYESPRDVGVAQFVGAAVLLDARIDDGAGGSGRRARASSALGVLTLAHVPAPGTDCVRALVRPEQIHILSPGAGVPATVTEVSFYGHDAAVRLEVDPSDQAGPAVRCAPSGGSGAAPLRVTARVLGRAVPEPGAVVGLEVVGGVVAFAG